MIRFRRPVSLPLQEVNCGAQATVTKIPLEEFHARNDGWALPSVSEPTRMAFSPPLEEKRVE